MNNVEFEQYRQEHQSCVGILERFAQKKYEDDQKAAAERERNLQNPNPHQSGEDKQRAAIYERTLNELQKDPQDSKVHAYAKMLSEHKKTKPQDNPLSSYGRLSAQQKEMIKLSEEELMNGGNLLYDANIRMIVIHASCPECGAELTTDMPKCFNPLTGESIAKHVCKNCGNIYNLEYAYPRFALIDSTGKEVKAFGI